MNILSQETRKARKEHVCNYCCEKILPGELYESSAIINEGEFYIWKNHIDCQELCRALVSEHYTSWEDGISDNDFDEACCECCRDNICSKCNKWDKENRECDNGKRYCLDKLKEKLLKHPISSSAI
jgi:hypothetical protein